MINLSLIIGITGAVSGFLICYLIPSFMHLRCIDNKACYKKLSEDGRVMEYK